MPIRKNVSQKMKYRKERVPELRVGCVNTNMVYGKRRLVNKLNIPISLERSFLKWVCTHIGLSYLAIKYVFY